MPDSYVAIEVLKSTLNIAGSTYADADLTAVLLSASRAIDNLCQRRFYADADAAQTRYYTATDRGYLAIDDLVAFTSLHTDPSGDGTFPDSWTQNVDFVLEPFNATADAADPKPYDAIRVHPAGSFVFPLVYPRAVKLIGQFGWADVPDAIQTATTVLASRLLTTSRAAPLGIMGFDGGAVRLAKSDPTVMMLIGRYMRHRIAVA